MLPISLGNRSEWVVRILALHAAVHPTESGRSAIS
jgi:hypothetical protein